MADIKGHYIYLPNVVAYDWVSVYETDDKEYKHQLVWARPQEDPGAVQYATKVGDRAWTTVRVRNPERLGFNNTLEGFKSLVEAFFAGRIEEKV